MTKRIKQIKPIVYSKPHKVKPSGKYKSKHLQ